MSLPGISGFGSHILVLRRKFSAGGHHNTVIVPLVAVDDAKVYVQDRKGNRDTIDWSWKKPLFALKETNFTIEDDKQLGAVFVHFPRK